MALLVTHVAARVCVPDPHWLLQALHAPYVKSRAWHILQLPPQSMPVSSPFFAPSEHVGQAAQLPPQSTPVSSPFFTPSPHVGHALQGPPQSLPDSP